MFSLQCFGSDQSKIGPLSGYIIKWGINPCLHVELLPFEYGVMNAHQIVAARTESCITKDLGSNFTPMKFLLNDCCSQCTTVYYC